MTMQEFENWKQHTATSSKTWTIDPIHNGKKGRDLLAHIGGEAGEFIRISDGGEVSLGSYTDAVPHIGEAEFKVRGRKQYESFSVAVARCVLAGGLNFLEAQSK